MDGWMVFFRCRPKSPFQRYTCSYWCLGGEIDSGSCFPLWAAFHRRCCNGSEVGNRCHSLHWRSNNVFDVRSSLQNSRCHNVSIDNQPCFLFHIRGHWPIQRISHHVEFPEASHCWKDMDRTNRRVSVLPTFEPWHHRPFDKHWNMCRYWCHGQGIPWMWSANRVLQWFQSQFL